MGHRSGSPSSLCSHSGVCSGRSSLLQVAGGALASRCTSELHLCALRDPTSAGVPPEGDYLEGDLACSALCSSRPHFSCGVGLECSSRSEAPLLRTLGRFSAPGGLSGYCPFPLNLPWCAVSFWQCCWSKVSTSCFMPGSSPERCNPMDHTVHGLL